MRAQFLTYVLSVLALGNWAFTSDARPRDTPVTRYKVTDLGTLPDCDVTFATGVNQDGWVSGYAYPYVPPGHGNEVASRPFIWRNGAVHELAKLGGEHGQALAINSRGDVAGYADAKDSTGFPVVWQRRGGFAPTKLSELPGTVKCLLDDGTAGGWVSKDDTFRAAIWHRGKLRVVGAPQDMESMCYAINKQGVAVGQHVPQGGQPQSPNLPLTHNLSARV